MNKNKCSKLNNKGMSLVEMIVVVLIIGILATAVILNIGQIYGRNARDAAEKLTKVLDRARMEAMNKTDGNVYVKLSIDGSDVVATIMYMSNNVPVEGDKTVLGNTGLTVKIMKFADANEELEAEHMTITEGDSGSFTFAFSKSTGAFIRAVATDPKVAGVSFSAMRDAEAVIVWDTGRSYVVSE